jgi:hypothetical protein
MGNEFAHSLHGLTSLCALSATPVRPLSGLLQERLGRLGVSDGTYRRFLVTRAPGLCIHQLSHFDIGYGHPR